VIVACAGIAGTTAATAGGAASAPHYVATYLPPGHRFSHADEYGHGESFVGYRDLGVWTHPDSFSIATTQGHEIVVRGHRGYIAHYIDEDVAYGRVVVWEERPHVWIEVGTGGAISRRRLLKVAEGVRAAGRGEWKRLLLESEGPPSVADLPRGRPSKVVLSGHARGHRWTLRALIPRGFPLDRNDRRIPCYELRYRRARSYGFDCAEVTSWWVLKGQVFVFGQFHSSARSVWVTPLGERHPRVHGRVGSVAPVQKWSFYVVPMPRSTCHVQVFFRTRSGRKHELGPTGPIFDPREGRRCSRPGAG
jgi:hypothetical protein